MGRGGERLVVSNEERAIYKVVKISVNGAFFHHCVLEETWKKKKFLENRSLLILCSCTIL